MLIAGDNDNDNDKDANKDKYKDKYKYKDKDKMLENPTHAILSKSRDFKDIKYDTLQWPPESPDPPELPESQVSPESPNQLKSSELPKS